MTSSNSTFEKYTAEDTAHYGTCGRPYMYHAATLKNAYESVLKKFDNKTNTACMTFSDEFAADRYRRERLNNFIRDHFKFAYVETQLCCSFLPTLNFYVEFHGVK